MRVEDRIDRAITYVSDKIEDTRRNVRRAGLAGAASAGLALLAACAPGGEPGTPTPPPVTRSAETPPPLPGYSLSSPSPSPELPVAAASPSPKPESDSFFPPTVGEAIPNSRVEYFREYGEYHIHPEADARFYQIGHTTGRTVDVVRSRVIASRRSDNYVAALIPRNTPQSWEEEVRTRERLPDGNITETVFAILYTTGEELEFVLPVQIGRPNYSRIRFAAVAPDALQVERSSTEKPRTIPINTR